MAQTTPAQDSRRPSRRRWPWGILVVIAVILLFFAAGLVRNAPGNGAGFAAAQDAGGAAVTATMGDLASSITASGNVQAERAVQLSLRVAGTVETVSVEAGDPVAAGDVLVQLDDDDLAREVAVAEQTVVIQEAALAELEDSTSAEELASAQASLDSARAALADVQDGPDAAEIAAARASLTAKQAAYASLLDGPDANVVAQALASLKNAEATLRKAQAAYDEVAGRPDVGMTQQALDLEQATNAYASAQASYDEATEDASDDELRQAEANVEQAQATLQALLDSPTPAELASAEAQVKQAEAEFTTIQEGSSIEQIESARAQVRQARLSLEAAQANLERATLVAPFDGIVTAVRVAEGEYASGLAVDLADPSSLHVVLDVDETDIGELAIGQPAAITLETWPDREIDGRVTRIAPKANDNSAIVSYAVDVAFGATDLPVREGMTADARLIIASHQNVLFVPNQAITPDRDAGKYYVDLIQSGPDGEMTTTRVEVTIGLKDGDHTEITSGLQAGDRVRLVATTASSSTTDDAGVGLMTPFRGGPGGRLPGGDSGGGSGSPFGG